MVINANNVPIKRPATKPPINPKYGLPVITVNENPKNAPIPIIPSKERFSTPAFSEYISPRLAIRSTVVYPMPMLITDAKNA